MNWIYTILCPQCGHTESRYDVDELVWKGNGAPPTSFGEEVEYQGTMIVGDRIVPTGESITTVIKCPVCEYGCSG